MRINHKQIIDNAGQIGMLQRKSGVRRKKLEEKQTKKEITRAEDMGEKVEISKAALETATEVKEETPQEETLQTKTERHMGKLEGQYGKPDEKTLRKQRPGDKRFTKKHGNTKLGTLEKTYGKIAPEGWDRDNTTLQDILDATGHSSLTQLLKHRKELKENPPELKIESQKTEHMATAPEKKPVAEQKPPEQQITPDQLPVEHLQPSDQQVLPEVKREEVSQEPPAQEPAPPPAPPPPSLPNAPGIIRYLNDRAFWREGYRSGFGDGTSPVQGRGGIPSPYWAKGYGEGFEDGRFTAQLHPAASWWPTNGAIYNPFGTPEYIYPQAPARQHPNYVQSRTIYQDPPKKSFLMATPDGSPSPEGQPGKEKNYHYKMKNGGTFYDKFLPDGSREQKVTGKDGETIKQVTVDSEGNQVCTSFAKDGSSKVETSEGKVMVFDKNGIMVQNYVENPPVSPEENFWQRVPPEANKTAPDPAVTKNLGKDDTITTYKLPDGNKFSEVKTACDGREHQVLTDGRGNMLQTVTRDPITGEQVKNIYTGGSVISEGNNGYSMAVDRNGRGQMYSPDGRPVMGNNYTPAYSSMPSYGMPSYGMMPGYGMMMPNYAMMGGLGMLGGLGMMGMGMMMPGGLGMMGYGLGGMFGGMLGSRLGYGMGGMMGGMLGGALGWGLGGMLGGGLGMGLGYGMGWGGLGMGWGLGGAMTMGGMGMAGLGNIYADGWLGW